MNPLRTSFLLLGAFAVAGAFAQGTQPAPMPQPPRPPVPPMVAPPPMPPMPPNMRNYRYMAPMGYQSRYMAEVIRTNRDDLKVSDAQMKIITDAREAEDKLAQDRAMLKMTQRNQLQELADAEKPDMAIIDAKVREMKKTEGDEMLADFKLTFAFKTALTPEQREKIKTMGPKFEPMMPMPPRPGMSNMPGMPGMPGVPSLAPGAPGGPMMPRPPAPTGPIPPPPMVAPPPAP